MACSEKERKLFPPLPETDLSRLADKQLYFSPAENVARRPPSHRDNNLPKVKQGAGLANKEPRVALTQNNIELLKNDMPATAGDTLGMTQNKNFVQSYLNNINR